MEIEHNTEVFKYVDSTYLIISKYDRHSMEDIRLICTGYCMAAGLTIPSGENIIKHGNAKLQLLVITNNPQH